MPRLLLLGRGAAFLSQYLWPAIALGFLAVVIAPAIWSRRRDRQRATLEVIRIILVAVTAVVVNRRRSHHVWQDVFADLPTSEVPLPLPTIESARHRLAVGRAQRLRDTRQLRAALGFNVPDHGTATSGSAGHP
jgi:hypothetical protein